MAKKKSKWLDLSAFDDGYDLGDIARTISRSSKKTSRQIKKSASNLADETLEFITSKAMENKVDTMSKNLPEPVFDNEKKRTYFNTGLFDDGYDLGDITKTILGTNMDIKKDLSRGVGKIGEGLVDTGAMAVGGVAKAFGNDDLYNKTEKFIKRDLEQELGIGDRIAKNILSMTPQGKMSSELFNTASNLVNKGNHEKASVLGDKSDSLVQSAGQLAGTAALQTVGVPWWLTTGVTSFGSGSEEALKNNASYGEALGYGAISAGSEVIFEKLSGGIKFGGKTLDEGIKRKISDAIANKTAKTLTKFGLDMAGEGAEEVLTEITQNIGKKLTYEDEKTWGELLTSEEAIDGYIESFIGGAVLGGGFSGANRVKAYKSGRDYDTGLTDNEQSVVDSEIKSRVTEKQKQRAVESEVNRIISEQEKTFGTLREAEKKSIREDVKKKLEEGSIDFTQSALTKKEQKEIEDQVKEDLQKGYIGIDSIENALAGEKTARIKELEQQMKNTTDAAKKSEIEMELNQLRASRASDMKGRLNNDTYLQESYRQEALKSQAFSREVNEKDSDITKELIESAKNSNMNNSRRMHDLFEYTNKIANDTNTKYGFVNNDQLKQLGHDVEGMNINGLVRVDKDGTPKVLINVDSDKALNAIIGHETTHILEDTNEYKALQDIVKEYATTKGDYDSKFKQMSKLYEGVDANIENEITADLVGDYLFTDEQFIQNLSVKEPNVFQKVYDYIKHVYKMATAGSKEARQLEQVKRRFDKAYKEISNTTTLESKTNSLTEADSNTKKGIALNEGIQFPNISNSSKGNISEKGNNVNETKYSLSDNQGRSLSKKQQDYFKDSKVRDENGNLLTMYHGTSAGGHTVFDPYGKAKYGLFGVGSYFTDNKSVAESYTEKGRGNNKQVYETYLNITNPIDMDAQGDPAAWSKALPDANFPAEGTNEDFYRAMEEYFEDQEYARWEASEAALDVMESMGYDGITHIGGGRFNKKDETRHRVYIAFNSEQIKDINNAQPTDNPDIRFSLSKPVEETKDLIAVHNMQSSELMKTLDLGGLPMPSIAIIKAQSGHSEYGDVSLLFNKETIDPKFMRANKVYGGDAWTPTYPTIEYKPNKKVAKRISDMYYELASEYGYDEVRPLYNYANDLEDALNRNKGEAGIMENLSDDTRMMQVYLLASGKGKVEDVEKEIVTELSEAEIEQYDHFIKTLGKDAVETFMNVPSGINPMKHKMGWIAEHKSEVENTYAKLLKESYGFTDAETENALNNTSNVDYMKMIRGTSAYLKNGSRTVKTEIDYEATEKKIKETAGDGYSKWLRDVFAGIEEKSGIRNNADTFTRSGNRRSWEALHWENNLENVVKVMKEEENGVGFFGGSGIWGVSAKEYGSIDEIRADSNRLERMNDEEYEAIKESLGQRFQEISVSIMDKTERNQFMAIDDAMGSIVDAVRSSKTKSGIMNVLKQYPQLDVTETTVNDIVELVQDIAAMPTEYFEAKPRRAVGLDEIAAVIIPDNADLALLNRLNEDGYNVVTYKAGDETDRAAKLNAQNDVMFSLSKNSEDIAPVGNYNVYGRDVKQQTDEAIAPIREDIKDIKSALVDLRENIATVNYFLSDKDIAPVRDDYKPLSDQDIPYVEQQGTEAFNTITDDMAPVEAEPPIYEDETIEPESPLEAEGRDIYKAGDRKQKAYMYENPEVKPFFQQEAEYMLNDLKNSVKGQKHFNDQLYYDTAGEQGFWGTKRQTSDEIAYLLDEFKYTYADIEKGLKAIIEDHGAENNAISKRIEFMIDERLREGYNDMMFDDFVPPNEDYLNLLRDKQITEYTDDAYEAWVRSLAEVEAPAEPITQGGIDYINNLTREAGIDINEILNRYGVGSIEEMSRDQYMEAVKWLDNEAKAPVKQATQNTEDIAPVREAEPINNAAEDVAPVREPEPINSVVDDIAPLPQGVQQEAREDGTIGDVQEDIATKTRNELRKELLTDRQSIVDAMENAKNRSMALLNNTDTIRVNELVFGREAGKAINEAIFQKEIDNEAKSIAWQNKQRDDIKKLGIKARSKMSAAVQKYGEGQYVNEFGDMVEYGDADLQSEFPNVKDQIKVRKAARVIKEKYEEYIEEANNVLTKLGFDPIPKRDDYMRHFQELNDVFSRNGIPFNPQNMKEHVLPTDINGLTEFWSPQKNFFANMQPRKGRRTTLDAITGIDGYISGVSNLIFHTEDIQRGRAFEEMVRETYGEEKGWDILETLPEEEQAARAEKIENNHLSNYAAWVHEWTNNVAGKKNKIDRSIESMFGRRAFSFLDETRKQVGTNMIGFNISSSMTNLIAPVQAMAKTNKAAVIKGTLDTFKNIVFKDNFADKNSFLTSRMGTDMISKTKWDKMRDAGYVFMKGMDWFASNQITRSKYYELRSKGMSEAEAHAESGKFAARILGDRTKGANAQLYNSKLIGMVTQFQLEVNNQLYSMFYDTYHDSKENAKGNALKTAAGMTFTLGQLFAFTHLFGKGFESLAGYNPTFDVIGIIATALGIGDDDEEKTRGERLEEASLQLLKSLPYTSTFTGGRIPIGSAFPIEQLVTGEDDYGNEKSRLKTLGEALPYFLMPGGYGQVKKTVGGLKMFNEDLPVSGSYTDSGNLRFPVEKTPENVLQAAIFGQWANENARDYFDNERAPLKEKQIQEYKDLDIPIADYWEYREGLKEQDSLEEKFDYIAGLDLPVRKKNIMINNIVDREDKVDMTNYNDFGSYEEFDFATKYPEQYAVAQAVGYDNYMFGKKALGGIYAEKDEFGNSIRGSRKENVINYLNEADLSYEEKIILYKNEYNSDDTYNMDIINYLNERDDISYSQMEAILTQLGFTVDEYGNIYW